VVARLQPTSIAAIESFSGPELQHRCSSMQTR
jgi:hypothetical protein